MKKLPTTCFISHSYRDKDALTKLLGTIPAHVKPVIFPPIRVPPEQMVSADLIGKILECAGLVYVEGGMSAESFWVAFEREYATLAEKRVFAFDPGTSRFRPDKTPPVKPSVFSIWSAGDLRIVQEVLLFLKRERYFDLADAPGDMIPGPMWRQQVTGVLGKRLAQGHYAVLFWSANAAHDDFILKELRDAGAQGEAFDGVVVACLDTTPLTVLRRMAPKVLNREPVRLFKRSQASKGRSAIAPSSLGALNQNHFDDLIVRLYWLIFQKMGKTGAH